MAKKLPRLIGVIHLPALAGAPGSREQHPAEALQRAGILAVREARILEQAGFEGIILENFGDIPFYKSQVPPETIASLAVIAAAVRESTRLPIGINVLRNDARAALGIAAATGCDFIRVNVLAGVAATDQGMIEGDAAGLVRERDRLGADIGILADAHVKHARTLSSDDLALAVEEVALRAGADGVIITGATTGRPVEGGALETASELARRHGIALYVGSGVTRATLAGTLALATGVIVGSDLRRGGKAGAPLEPARCREIARAFAAAAALGRREPKPKPKSGKPTKSRAAKKARRK